MPIYITKIFNFSKTNFLSIIHYKRYHKKILKHKLHDIVTLIYKYGIILFIEI